MTMPRTKLSSFCVRGSAASLMVLLVASLAACAGKEKNGNGLGGDGDDQRIGFGDAGQHEGRGDGDGEDGDGDGDGGDGDRGDGDGDRGPVSCTPITCAAEGYTCGRLDDGCGGVITCGTCEDGTYCSPDTHQCEEPVELCLMRECGAAVDACGDPVLCGSSCDAGEVCKGGVCETCTPRGCDGSCGTISDGCGQTLECGGCGDGQACDALTHECTSCEPTTCMGQGVECGTISDGCGQTLDCQACAGGKTCVSGKCVAPPLPAECTAQMANCGEIEHACTGEEIQCGKCPAGEACVDNVCKSCVPTSCEEQGVSCGTIKDGCGAELHCGACPDADGVCYKGACCQPTTCEQQGKQCGTTTDGCGKTLDCGNCDPVNNSICGYETGPNQCGVCVPTKTCTGLECGTLHDGCKEVNCGSCDEQSGEYCGGKGTGVANICSECVPDPLKTCAGLSAANGGKETCGVLRSPCGNEDCQGCPEGQKCGAGGVANVCDVCVPTSDDVCAGKNCGTAWNGCENVRCGPDACAEGETCGANGVANVCGVCSPVTSCAEQGKVCGTVWNGCVNEVCPGCEQGEKCINNGAACCKPRTCAEVPSSELKQCGTLSDGCGGNIQCDCPYESQNCVTSGDKSQCCTRRTCQEIAAQVGGNSPKLGCVNGPQTNFVECGQIVQCELCAVIID